MSTISVTPGTILRDDTDIERQTGEPEVAHIVRRRGRDNAAAEVLAARIEGTPLEALCGATFIPSKDPKRLPVCQACADIYNMYRAFNDGLGETPPPA